MATRSSRLQNQSARKSDGTTIEFRRALQVTFMARERQQNVKGETPPTVADLTNPQFMNQAREYSMTPRDFYVYLGGDIKALPKSVLHERVAKIVDRELRQEEQERDEYGREP